VTRWKVFITSSRHRVWPGGDHVADRDEGRLAGGRPAVEPAARRRPEHQAVGDRRGGRRGRGRGRQAQGRIEDDQGRAAVDRVAVVVRAGDRGGAAADRGAAHHRLDRAEDLEGADDLARLDQGADRDPRGEAPDGVGHQHHQAVVAGARRRGPGRGPGHGRPRVSSARSWSDQIRGFLIRR
jgi:hypothetical protein